MKIGVNQGIVSSLRYDLPDLDDDITIKDIFGGFKKPNLPVELFQRCLEKANSRVTPSNQFSVNVRELFNENPFNKDLNINNKDSTEFKFALISHSKRLEVIESVRRIFVYVLMNELNLKREQVLFILNAQEVQIKNTTIWKKMYNYNRSALDLKD